MTASVRVTRLSNGLRVVSDVMPHLETASVGIWVEAGARSETAEENGIAHLLEHMAFKGTARRSALDIAEQIEAVGGHLNAYTARDSTAYYARVMRADVPLAVDILADILQNSVFDAAELEREREVILQEIGEAEDMPDDIVFDHLQDAAWPGQPMGRPILGTRERVQAFDGDAIRGYLGRHYSAPAMILAGAGAVDHDRLVDLAGEAFAGLKGAAPRPVEPARWQGGVRREDRDLEQVHLTLGLPGLSWTDPDFFAHQVYACLLGGGMSSRLFQEVREKRGLAYAVSASATSYGDAGMMTIYAGTGAGQVATLLAVTDAELDKLADRAPGEAECSRGRAQLKASLLMALEASATRCEQLARHLAIHGRVLPTPEILAAIDAVTPQAVQACARRVLTDGPRAVAAVGPAEGLAALGA